MNFIRFSYVSGFLIGLTAVILGALGAHALEGKLTPDQLDSYETAVRFQMYHSLLLIILGLLQAFYSRSAMLRAATLNILIGTLLFSGSIYLLVLTPIKVGIVTPIGGTILIIGWGFLALWGFRLQANPKTPTW